MTRPPSDPNTPSQDTPRPDTPRLSFRDLIQEIRVNQWTKNAVVLAAFFFAFWDRTLSRELGLPEFLGVLLATAVFCLISSGVYLINDIADIRADQAHPLKRFRPLAAGRLRLSTAWGLAFLLVGGGLLASLALPTRFTGTVGAYVALQLLYTFCLKRIALLDIMVIATGFVLRAVAGAVAIGVQFSAWLLLCAFLLALFLALCKRCHEKRLVGNASAEQRPSLEAYDARLLDTLIAAVCGATIVAYSLYTLSAETHAKFGTQNLGLTIPFVVFGLFRYLDLVYRHKKGDRPEQVLLTDLPLLANIALYAIAIVAIFCLRH